MAQLTKQFTFIPDTTIQPDEVNANFDDIVNFLNTQVAHLDAPAFSGIPTVPALDPTSPVHVASKAYVDAKVGSSSGLPKFGTYTGSTDGFSQVTVSHGLGRMPLGGLCTINCVTAFQGGHLQGNVIAATTSTITFKFFNNGQAFPGGSIRFHWCAF